MPIVMGEVPLGRRGAGPAEIYEIATTQYYEMGRFRTRLASGEGAGVVREEEFRTFNTPEELREFTNSAATYRGHRATLGSQMTWSHAFARTRDEMTDYSWNYRTTSLVLPYIDSTFHDQLVTEVVVLPQPYYEVARRATKQAFFLEMLRLESLPEDMTERLERLENDLLRAKTALAELPRLRHLNPGDVQTITSHQRAKLATVLRGQVDQAETNLARARQRMLLSSDKRRPTRQQVRAYFAPKLRRAIVDLLAGGHYIEHPGTDYVPPSMRFFNPDPERAAGAVRRLALEWQDAVADLNQFMRDFPLGRNSHLKFVATPQQRRVVVNRYTSALTPTQRRTRQNPLVVAYVNATHAQRLAMLAANPGGLPFLLEQAALPVLRASYRKPGAPAPAPLRTPAKTPTPS